MNIEVNSKVTTTNNISTTSSSKAQADESVKFSDELSNLSSKEETSEAKENVENNNDKVQKENNDIDKTDETKELKESKKTEEKKTTDEVEKNENSDKINEDPAKNTVEKVQWVDNNDDAQIDEVIDGLEDVVAEMNDKFNKPENKKEDNALINNDMNIQESKDPAFQMNANMNFNSDAQPFANFINNQNEQKLNSSDKDLEEENAILSTMSENIAMANKNRILNEAEAQNNQRVKTVSDSQGIKKVDKQSNVTLETVVKYDTVVMNKDDVDFFAKLVENGQTDMTQATQKSAHVSKTLADMLAKSMKDNQPVRIDFDNNISVIIKVSRDGKISADFLPSSQVAEAYLKENLPLLKQRFDDNNIEYDELNQRQRKQDDKENRKKEQKDE